MSPAWLMAQSNAAFALLTLGQWCRNHGIHEARDVLARALKLAQHADSNEALAEALEGEALTIDAVVCPAPQAAPAADPAPQHRAEHEPAADDADAGSRKGKRSGAGGGDADHDRS